MQDERKDLNVRLSRKVLHSRKDNDTKTCRPCKEHAAYSTAMVCGLKEHNGEGPSYRHGSRRSTITGEYKPEKGDSDDSGSGDS